MAGTARLQTAAITALALGVLIAGAPNDANAQSGVIAKPAPPVEAPPAAGSRNLQHQPLTGAHDSPVMDNEIYVHGLVDQFENRTSGGRNTFKFDGQGWVGTDYNRIWLKTEGKVQENGTFEDARHELLYSRAISTYFDLQGGVRYDVDSGPNRAWLSVGVQGLALYFFELTANAYMSDSGHFAARLAGSYDFLITQRLILQPEAELNFYSKQDPGRRIGSGLADLDLGLRLRYEITRKFAPYIGITYEQKSGPSARFAAQEGEPTHDVRFVIGLRAWF